MNPSGFLAALAANLHHEDSMSEWADGYRQGLRDLSYLAKQRGVMTVAIQILMQDLERDAFVIGHEYDNKHQRRKMAVIREAMAEPLLPIDPPRQLVTRPTR